MPEVIVENLQNKVISYTDSNLRLLDVLSNATDWMSTCGGKGMCGTCIAEIIIGEENLNLPTNIEERFRRWGKLGQKERLMCQCRTNENVTIRVPERSKFPHLDYSE